MSGTWYQVDNVAKLFIATNNRRDPRVFRVCCTLDADIDPGCLAEALHLTARQFPNFQVTLHRGLFWHYMESTGKLPAPLPETLPPCAPVYGPDLQNELLYRVSYYGPRINVEMFHALSDGNGGLLFLKALVCQYLKLQHPDALANLVPETVAPAATLAQDSYRQFYGAAAQRDAMPRRACRLRSSRLPYDQTQFFEAHMPVKAVLAAARAEGVTLTSWLGARLMLAVYAELPLLERRRPVAVSLPVNLRNYYPSETARNFFNSIRVAQQLTGRETPASLAASFDAALKIELSEERVKARMDGFERFERLPFVKPVPLVVKNRVVAAVTHFQERYTTATLSNLGAIKTPPELAPWLRGFAAMSSTSNLFACVCSWQEDLVVCLSSAYRSTGVPRRLFSGIAAEGIEVTLYANEVVTG